MYTGINISLTGEVVTRYTGKLNCSKSCARVANRSRTTIRHFRSILKRIKSSFLDLASVAKTTIRRSIWSGHRGEWIVRAKPELFECKSSEGRVVYKKAELNRDFDSENNHRGSSLMEGELTYREFERTIETETGPVKVQWPVTEIVVDSFKVLDRKRKDTSEPKRAA